jgi:hypothetical protein
MFRQRNNKIWYVIWLLLEYAFYALKKMGNSFYDEAAEYVKKHGSPEIKMELLGWENSWKTEKE